MQLSKAPLASSSLKPVPVQSPSNRAGSYPQPTVLPHSSKKEPAGHLVCFSVVVIKYLDKSNANEPGSALLTDQGCSPSWRAESRQQELEAAGPLTSNAEKKGNGCLCMLSLFLCS